MSLTVAQARKLLEQSAATKGNGPPTDVTASELWARLTQRPRPHKVVSFPVRPGEESPGSLRLQILTEGELHQCRAGASAFAREATKSAPIGDLGYDEIYRNELMVQLMAIAARDVNAPALPAFPSAEAARGKLVSDEYAVLYQHYLLLKVESGPIIAEMTEAEMDAWVARLMEGADASPLGQHSSGALIGLIEHLVSKLLMISPTDSFSSGSPPAAEVSAPSPSK